MSSQKIDWEAVKSVLPSGSGIDAGWKIAKSGESSAVFNNSFHGMDEMGGYDGWLDFRVVFYRHDADKLHPLKGPLQGKAQVLHCAGDWDFRIVGRFSDVRRKSWGYDLRDYLEEVVSESLRESGFKFLCGEIHSEVVDAI